jgi:hypothetical protein
MLDRLAELDVPISLPPHLAAVIGEQVVPARTLGENWAGLMSDAAGRLQAFDSDEGRSAWLRAHCGPDAQEVETLEHRRRELAAVNAKDPALREMGKRQKELQQSLLARLIEQIHRDWQVSQLDYWDSRGALWAWALALGGEEFYNSLLDRAEIYEETAEPL